MGVEKDIIKIGLLNWKMGLLSMSTYMSVGKNSKLCVKNISVYGCLFFFQVFIDDHRYFPNLSMN